jgi:hypothetical protein
MPYEIIDWKQVRDSGVELAVFKAVGQCVSMSPRPIARVHLRGSVEITVSAHSQHKVVAMAQQIKELYE